MSVSERLAQEDRILREIRLSLSAYRTMESGVPRRKGVAYASAAITSGARLYEACLKHGFAAPVEFRRAMPNAFRDEVFKPNLAAGKRFGEFLQRNGWPQVIVPGAFFASGWDQEHYMSLWREVIVRHARTVSVMDAWAYSLGSSEEVLIALKEGKSLRHQIRPLPAREALDEMRTAMDWLDGKGFDIKPHYELWRKATLALESRQPVPKTA